MRFEVLFEKGDYALIVRKNNLDEYAVVYGLDKENGEWRNTCSYCNFGKYSPVSQHEALLYMLDVFMYKTEENYITRSRLEELATKFKDGLCEYADEYELEEFCYECDMNDYEKKFFGLEDE